MCQGERKSGKECGSGVRQNLNPFNGDKSPSARALLRRAGRQFVRVYPTYPDISTARPGVARVANHPPTFLTSSLAYSPPAYPFPLSHLHSIFPFFDFPFISSFHFISLSFVLAFIFPISLFTSFRLSFRCAPSLFPRSSLLASFPSPFSPFHSLVSPT